MPEESSGTFPLVSPSSPPLGGFASTVQGLAPAEPSGFLGSTTVLYRDTVFGGERRSVIGKLPDPFKEGLDSGTRLGGARLKPVISFLVPIQGMLWKEWEDCFIVSVIGLRFGYLVLRENLNRLWCLKGYIELLDLRKGFILVKLECQYDGEMVVIGGLWMGFYRFLAVSPWTAMVSGELLSGKGEIVMGEMGKVEGDCLGIDEEEKLPAQENPKGVLSQGSPVLSSFLPLLGNRSKSFSGGALVVERRGSIWGAQEMDQTAGGGGASLLPWLKVDGGLPGLKRHRHLEALGGEVLLESGSAFERHGLGSHGVDFGAADRPAGSDYTVYNGLVCYVGSGL